MKFLLCVVALIATATAMSVKMAPLLAADSDTAIAGSYIVVFRDDIAEEKIRHHHAIVAEQMLYYNNKEQNEVRFKYNVFKGYSAKMNDELRDKVRLMPEVKYVERNQEVHLVACSDDTSAGSWGLERTTITGRVTTPYEYLYDEQCSGQGVDVYVIDTGIDDTHPDFGGRARQGANFVDGEDSFDGNGHGTHVAGTVMANTYGLARAATSIAVKVLNRGGSGTYEAVIAGIDYVAAQRGTTGRPSIINMSLGGGRSEAVNDAVKRAFDAGVHVVVAAGNEATNACSRSPASAEYATTVGATDINDAIAYFSNYGECTEIFGPGVSIIAPVPGGGYATYSGTSMASPHVAGVLAKYLTGGSGDCSEGQADDPEGMEDYIKSKAVRDVITGIPPGTNTPNELVHMPCDL